MVHFQLIQFVLKAPPFFHLWEHMFNFLVIGGKSCILTTFISLMLLRMNSQVFLCIFSVLPPWILQVVHWLSHEAFVSGALNRDHRSLMLLRNAFKCIQCYIYYTSLCLAGYDGKIDYVSLENSWSHWKPQWKVLKINGKSVCKWKNVSLYLLQICL